MSDRPPTAEPPSQEERLRKLAADKSNLEIVIRMMNRLRAVPGLDDTIESMLRAVGDVIGGVNLVFYYRASGELHYVDVCGVKKRLRALDDDLVLRAFETREPVEREHPFGDTHMRTREFSKAYTWAVPLLVGPEVIGVLKMESLHLGMRDLSPQLPTFFGYAALVLQNEIQGHELFEKSEQSRLALARLLEDEKRVVGALRESERRLAEAERVAHIGYWERDQVANRIHMSEETYSIFGMPLEERYRDSAEWDKRWLQLIHPEDVDKAAPSSAYSAEGGSQRDVEYRVVHPSGEVRYVHSVRAVNRDESGRPLRWFGVLQDVTEQKRAEEALRRLNRELRAISNCNQTLMRAQDEQSLLDEVCRIVCEDAGYLLAWVGYAEHDEARSVRTVARAGIDEGYLADARITWADTEYGQGPAGTVIRTGETVYVQDFATLPGFEIWRESARKRGYRSGIALPLKDDSGAVFGAFLLYSGDVNAFTPDEIRLQEELAGDLAFGITVLRGRAERRRAEEKLAYLAAIVESTDDAIIGKSLDERILSWNCGAERLYGYAAEEVLGQPISILVPPGLEAELAAIMERLRRGERVEHLETLRARKDGELIHVALTISPIKDAKGLIIGASTIARDITPQRRYVAELRAAQDEMRATNARYARQEAALMAVTRACALHQANTADLMREVTRVAARTLDVERTSIWRFTRDRQGIVCRSLFEQTRGTHCDGAVLRTAEHPAYFRALAAGDVIAASDARSDPRTMEFADGYLRPLGISSMLDAPILVTGSIAGVLCCEHVGPARQWTHDEQTFAIAIANLISLLLAEEERQVIEGQLRQSQKMEAIGQLAGGVAHDFNNILTAIVMQVEITGMIDDLPEEVRDGLREIGAAADRAANLTRQLLLFSRRQVMQPRDLDLNDVVTNLARMLLRIIGEDVRLQLHLHPTPLMTRADAGMLDQVLVNLSVNARDAMPGGGRLLIETSETTVGEDAVLRQPDAAPGRYVCLSVGDTGTGIPPDVLPHIFEPFFTTKEQGKGTGLGLATVFGIVQQHHGWTRVRTEPGKGTTFDVLLPALESAPAGAAGPVTRPGARGGTETILLVEDESAVRALTRTILERRGYRVLEAPTGVEALAIWRQHRAEVALLVTDLVMPGGVSGQQLAQQLQADKPRLEVIFISGYSAEVAGKEIRLRGSENFLQKPFAPSLLLETVRRCLDG